VRFVHIHLGAIAAAALTLAAVAPDALAGTATNLKCEGCVGTRDIGKGQVKARNLHKSAKPAAIAASVKTGFVVDATDTTQVVRKVTITAPGPGAVTATANAVVDHAEGGVFCKIDTAITPIVQADEELCFGYRSDSSSLFSSVSGQTVFVVSAGKLDVYFLCRRVSSANTPRLFNATLTALFVANAQVVKKVSADAAVAGK